MSMLIEAIERRWVPDRVTRWGIRQLLRKRLKDVTSASGLAAEQSFIASLKDAAIAEQTAKANEQHYEVPAEFFTTVLGPRLKYSSCYWPDGVDNLAAAEEAMLKLTCERAGLVDGQHILELGCGWGSLTLWMAQQYPKARITAVSNSHSQRAFILDRAKERGLDNISVITADMNDFETDADTYDRVVSIEMFEHMRNYPRLLERIHSWLKPDGACFVHIFCHRERTYPFETAGEYSWMARYFFTGGQMPAEKLLSRFSDHLKVEQQWKVDGIHYAKTLLAWLHIMDAKEAEVLPMLKKVYGDQDGARWFQRWRLFFMACEELFRYRRGTEWYVTHMLLTPQPATH